MAVSGCKAFVVQNYLGDEELDPSITCASAPRQSSVLRRRLGNYCHMRLDPKARIMLCCLTGRRVERVVCAAEHAM